MLETILKFSVSTTCVKKKKINKFFKENKLFFFFVKELLKIQNSAEKVYPETKTYISLKKRKKKLMSTVV